MEPLPPVFPFLAWGKPPDVELAAPVLPELVPLNYAVLTPDPPDVAMGLAVMLTLLWPPLDSLIPMLDPPRRRRARGC